MSAVGLPGPQGRQGVECRAWCRLALLESQAAALPASWRGLASSDCLCPSGFLLICSGWCFAAWGRRSNLLRSCPWASEKAGEWTLKAFI